MYYYIKYHSIGEGSGYPFLWFTNKSSDCEGPGLDSPWKRQVFFLPREPLVASRILRMMSWNIKDVDSTSDLLTFLYNLCKTGYRARQAPQSSRQTDMKH